MATTGPLGDWLARLGAGAGIAALGAAAIATLTGCAVRRATAVELQGRAIFDLGCPAQHVQVVPLGPRTRAVSGCGRRLVYVERCEAAIAGDEACAWLLDTPMYQQDQWPQTVEGQMLAAQQWARAALQAQTASTAPSAPAGTPAASDKPLPSTPFDAPAPAASQEPAASTEPANNVARMDPREPVHVPVPPRKSRALHTDLFDDGKTKPINPPTPAHRDFGF